jgi:hypothetical protein
MILTEKDMIELGRERRVTFPKKPEKKPDNSTGTPVIFAAINMVFNLVGEVKRALAINFKSVESKIDLVIKKQASIPKPAPEKKPDKWEFKLIRDIDNKIQKIEATRRS